MMKKIIPHILLFFIYALPVHAAQVMFTAPSQPMAPGSEFVVDVFLDTQGKNINAFQGQLNFSEELLEIVEIRDSSSILTVWLEPPAALSSSSIAFSGITPGGYNGSRGMFFSVVFRAKTAGEGLLSFGEAEALQNDGAATAVTVTARPTGISITADAQKILSSVLSDEEPPESFSPSRIQNTEAFDGKNVVVFATQDKGSGMARYEVCEGLLARCITATSPYVLKNQRGDTLITVRAFDNAGNMRSGYLFTSEALMKYALYTILAILVCVGVRFFFKRSPHTNS